MAPQSSTLAWKIPWREEPSSLQSMGLLKSPAWLSDFTFPFHFHALEKEMATHSSILAWRIPGTEEPSGLPSMGSYRVGHDWSDLACIAFIMILLCPKHLIWLILLLLLLSRFSHVRLCVTHRRQPTRLPVPGILQARTLDWVAISFSNVWKWKVKMKLLSRVRL